MSTSESPRNVDLQVLRAVAAVYVVLQHIGQILPLPKGLTVFLAQGGLWGGVDLFFALSGYVITRSLHGGDRGDVDRRLGSAGFRAFWIKRTTRLLPAAWLWAFIPLLFVLLPMNVRGLRWHELWPATAAALVPVANVYWAECGDRMIFGGHCAHSFAGAWNWSLSLEEQFYLVLSLFLLWLPLRRFLWLAMVLVVGSMFLDRPFNTYAWLFRVDALCLGVCVYYLRAVRFAGPPRLGPRARAAVIVLAVALLPWLGGPQVNSLTAMAVAAAAAVWAASYDGAFGSGPVVQALRFVGDRSYSLYLCHMPVLLAVRLALPYLPGSGGFQAVLLSVAFMAVCAECTYRWVEQPLTAAGRRLAARSPAPAGPALPQAGTTA